MPSLLSSKHHRRPLAALVVGIAALGLAACSTDPVAQAGPSDSPDETITVQSEFGEVTLPAEPKAALGMYTTDVDILITLGIPLAKQQPIRGDGWTDFPEFFPQDVLADITPFANYPDYNYEKILETQPDMILNGLGYDKKTVKRLAEIAPTYSLDAFDGRSWMEHFEETAEALGRTEQYQAWVDSYQVRLEEVKAEIDPDEQALVYGPISYWDGQVSSGCYTGVECSVLDDLGLTVFSPARSKDGQGITLSGERLGQLSDLDVVFTFKIPGEPGDAEFQQMLDQLGENPLWTQLPFVENDQIYPYDLEMTYGSPSGQMAFLNLVGEALTDG